MQLLKKVHQTLGNMVKPFELQECYLDEDDPWKGKSAAAAFALRSTVHSTLQKFSRSINIWQRHDIAHSS